MTNDQKQGIIMHVRKTLLSEKFAKEAISMKERERVLELVKKGILTSEEALILLENMATEKDEKQIEKAAEKVDTQNIGTTNKEDQVADLMDALEKGEAEGPTVDSFEENTQDQLPMPKSICFFNHKGGVSKTTTAFNIGWGLASTGKKVMLVDLDSQCNLTGMVLGYTTVSESLDNFYSSRYNLTMESIVDTLMNGSSVEDLVNNDTAKLFQCQNNNLFLLPGHLSVSMLDSQISVALKIASGVPLTRNLPGNLPKVINLIAKKNGIDYIVYDLSPSVGGLNEIALMSSDYFIVPATPDFFCWQAINSLSETITAWHAELEFFKQTSRSNTAANISNKPKFIGAIHQRYRPRNGMPVKSFEHWVKEIHGAVNSVLAPALHRIGCSATEHEIQKSLDLTDTSHLKAYDLAQISDFNSLIAISQKLSKPVFAITDQDLRDDGKAGNVFDTMSENRNLFLQQFERLCQRVLILTA